MKHYRSRSARKIRHRIGVLTGGVPAGLLGAGALHVATSPKFHYPNFIFHAPTLARMMTVGALGVGAAGYGLGRGATALVQKARRKHSKGGWRKD